MMVMVMMMPLMMMLVGGGGGGGGKRCRDVWGLRDLLIVMHGVAVPHMQWVRWAVSIGQRS